MMMKVLLNGLEARLFVEGQEAYPVGNEITVVWEFEPELELPAGAQIQHHFTSEGVMVDAIDDERADALCGSPWSSLAEDAGWFDKA